MADRPLLTSPDDLEREQAELLDRYGDALHDGENGVRPDELDSDLAVLTRGLHDRSMALVPDRRFDAALRARLEASWRARDAAADRRSRPSWLRSTRRKLAGLAAASLLAVAVLGFLVVTGQEDALSGADILRTAQAAAETPAALGVTSFEMTVATWRLPLNSDRTIDFSGAPITSESHMWFTAPDLRRIEMDGGIGVWDGTSYWMLMEEWDQFFVFPETDLVTTSNWLAPGGLVGLPSEGDMQTTRALAADCFQGRVAGDETIAGRPVHVVELDQTNCPSEDPEVGRRVVWVDQETGFVLKLDEYAASDDDVLISSIAVSSAHYNVPVDPERFTFTPPGGAELQVDPGSVGAHVTELDSLAEAEAVTTFAVRTPTDIPADFTLDRIRHAWPVYMTTNDGELVGGPLADDWLEVRYARADGGWLDVDEGYSRRYYSWFAVAPPQDRGTALVAGRPVYWVEGTPPSGVVDSPPGETDIAAVFWHDEWGRHEHRYVVLASSILTVDELMKLAESLE